MLQKILAIAIYHIQIGHGTAQKFSFSPEKLEPGYTRSELISNAWDRNRIFIEMRELGQAIKVLVDAANN